LLHNVIYCQQEYSVGFVNFLFDLRRLRIRSSLRGLRYRVVLFLQLNLMW
jgi:hypothetical protein